MCDAGMTVPPLAGQRKVSFNQIELGPESRELTDQFGSFLHDRIDHFLIAESGPGFDGVDRMIANII